jgi:predicted small lipoprotein YifL
LSAAGISAPIKNDNLHREFTMKWKYGVSCLVVVIAMTALVNCSKKGPAEKAGEKIDQGIESAKDKADDLVNEKGPLEKMGEKADSVVEKAEDALKSE